MTRLRLHQTTTARSPIRIARPVETITVLFYYQRARGAPQRPLSLRLQMPRRRPATPARRSDRCSWAATASRRPPPLEGPSDRHFYDGGCSRLSHCLSAAVAWRVSRRPMIKPVAPLRTVTTPAAHVTHGTASRYDVHRRGVHRRPKNTARTTTYAVGCSPAQRSLRVGPP